MKIEKVQQPTWRLELTDDELQAIYKLLGRMSEIEIKKFVHDENYTKVLFDIYSEIDDTLEAQ